MTSERIIDLYSFIDNVEEEERLFLILYGALKHYKETGRLEFSLRDNSNVVSISVLPNEVLDHMENDVNEGDKELHK